MCVRVTDMRGIDLSVFRFDYDLTLAMLLMNADGTIYHQYGNRDKRGASSHLSESSLARLLRDTLPEHAAYQADPKPPKPRKPETVESLPRWDRDLKSGKQIDCFHCHMIGEAYIDADRKPRPDATPYPWQWPSASRVGLTLDRDDQRLVRAVEANSAAASAGFAVGDRLTSLDGQIVRTEGDVQRILEDTPGKAAQLPFEVERADAAVSGTLKLAKGWKETTFLDVSWRSSVWSLSPKPGFGGPPLGAGEKKRHGIPESDLAFRVKYIVTWGPNSHTGRNAAKAGIRKGDIIVSVDGKSDFPDVKGFHSWFRLTREIGKTVEFEIIRGDERRTIKLKTME